MNRFFLAPVAAALLLFTPAHAAPTEPKAPIKARVADPLAIPNFPVVPSEFVFAGTQKDLLGMIQSFAKGMQVEGAKPASPSVSGAAAMLSSDDLFSIFQQIHVLRVKSLSFRGLSDEERDAALKVPAAPTGSMTAPAFGDGQKQYDLEQGRLAGAQKFYADEFAKQGGKQQLMLRSGKTQVAVFLFEAPKSWALLTRGPSRVVIVRADGLPKLDALGRLFRVAMSGS